MRIKFATGLIVACCGLFVGCGEQPIPKFRIKGQISYDGRPIPRGRINFDAASAGGASGAIEIRDGQFETTATNGFAAGKYQLRILGFNGISGDELPWGQPLFPEYQMTQEVEPRDMELKIDIPKVK